MALSQTEISRLYVSIFGRASEGEGNNFWQNYSDDMQVVADAMLNTTAAQEYFGNTLNDNREFIKFIYANTLSKTEADDPEGINYWVSRLDSGESKGSVIEAMVYAATTPQNAGDAQNQFNNRVEVSNFTANEIYSFNGDYQQFRSYIDGVSHNSYTKEAIKKAIVEDAQVKAVDNLPQKSDPEVAPLISGYEWKDKIVTFSFNQYIPPEYQNHQESYKITNNWQPFDERDKEIAREAMKKIGEFSGLKLMEVATGGDIRFNKVDMNYGENGFTLLPTSDNDPLAGDVWINNLYNSESQGGNAPQSYGYLTILHEIGHALGLKHPFEDYPVLPRDRDNTNYTIMSYTQKNSVTLDFITDDYSYKCKTDVNAMPSNYQMYDMEAIIATYGANLEYHKEDDIYKLSQLYENHQYLTIWDAGGEDTIDISEVTHASAISLNSDYLSSIDFHSIAEQEDKTVAELGAENDPDMVSWIHDAYNNPQCSQGNGIYTGEGNLGIAKGVIIENVVSGSGNDSIIDNSASNKIYAGAGDDQIYLSYGGYDIVDGGEGVDTVFIQKAHAEIALEKNLYGNVFIFDSQSDEIIAELSGVEKIHLTDEVLDIT